MRPSGRSLNEIRSVSIETHITKHSEGSCLIKCGETHVICTATIDEKVPPFLRNSGLGWVTAEYGMLPRSTNTRMRRESGLLLSTVCYQDQQTLECGENQKMASQVEPKRSRGL